MTTPVVLQSGYQAIGSGTISWTADPTAGRVLLLAVIRRDGSGSCSALTSGWSVIAQNYGAGSFDDTVVVFGKVSDGTESALSFSIPSNPSSGLAWILFEVPGVTLPVAEQKPASPSLGSGTSLTGGSVSTTGAGVIIGAWAQETGTGSYSPGSGWTELGEFTPIGSHPSGCIVYQSVGTATTANPATTSNSGSDWRGLAIALDAVPVAIEPKIVLTINGVEFENLVEKRIRVELNDTGVVTFAIHRGHAQATAANLARGNLVEVTIPEIDPDPFFEGFLDSGDFALVASSEEGGEILSFAAPGSLSYLRRARIHFTPLQSPASVVKLSRGTWEWINQEAGDIVQRIVSEADDRGVLPGMTLTFGEVLDSAGVPWVPMGSWVENIGADLLEAVQRLVAAGQLHVEMGPGLELNLYQTIGTDRSSTSFATGKVRFAKGVNIVDEVTRGMSGPAYASRALVHGDDGSWREVTTGSAPYEAEVVVEVGSHDPDVMDAAGERALEARESAQESIIFGHRVPWPGDEPDELSGIYLPGPEWTENGKYWVGDLVTLYTGTGDLDYDNETFRVYAITMYEDQTGYLAPPIVELNAPYVEAGESDGAGVSALPAGSGGTTPSGGTTAHSHPQYQIAGEDQWKQPVRCATTGSITIATALNAGDTIDGVTLAAGDRVLVKDQGTASQNGIYVAGTTPTRATDLDADDEVLGAIVYVIAGTTNAGTAWRVDNATATVVGTDAIDWEAFGGTTNAELNIEGGQSVIDAHGNTGATETIDPTQGNVHTMTLDADCTFTLSAPVGSGACFLWLWVTQDGTGGRDITWPGSVTVEGTHDTTAGTTQRCGVETLDGGTTWVATWIGSGGGTPATTVEAETTFGIASAVGTDTEYARQDHTHGTPSVATLAAAGRWVPLMDGLGNVVTDSGTGEAVMAFIT